ncbi:hypothetical protein V8D89_003021 [Ganoderma adspersum]
MACLLSLTISLLALVSYGLSTPLLRLSDPPRRPLVIWHGLGDSYASPGMLQFMQLIKEIHPGMFIHSIRLDEDLEKDQKAGFFGDVNEQLELVNEQIGAIPELHGGFDAIGFSQGGQFLRAYVERYNAPPINNLITFGSQHMGVSDLPLCSRWDIVCHLARRAARGGVYTEWAQHNLIQAQYFRDPDQIDAYLNSSSFLASINNEVPAHANATYAAHLATLNALVLVLFSADKTVVPKESAWFGSYSHPNGSRDGNEKVMVPMRLQPLYAHDWIGLRKLDEAGRVSLETCEGEHMQLAEECWRPLVERFTGGLLEEYAPVWDEVLRVQN